MSTIDVGDITRLGITFTDLDDTPVDPDSVRLKVREPGATTTTTYTYGSSAELQKDSVGVYYADLEVTKAGRWIYRWEAIGGHDASETGEFVAQPDPFDDPAEAPGRFATVEDVRRRLGLASLTDDQTATVELLLDQATGLITDAVGQTDSWAAELTPVPTVVRGIAIEVARRGYLNPGGVTSRSEQLGQHQYSETYARPAAGAGGQLELTPTETLSVRRAIHGRITGGARGESLADMIADEFYDLVDEDTTT